MDVRAVPSGIRNLRQHPISVPVSSVILYAISLAEAFVVSFRSRPIMMGDVLAVKTAMTVAGSYDYTRHL